MLDTFWNELYPLGGDYVHLLKAPHGAGKGSIKNDDLVVDTKIISGPHGLELLSSILDYKGPRRVVFASGIAR